MTKDTKLAVMILAAGQGTRMRSTLPKVCHTIGGAPLLRHVMETAISLNPLQLIPVISPNMPLVNDVVCQFDSNLTVAYQKTQEGTGHAVSSALDQLDSGAADVLVLYGDTPLIKSETLQAMLAKKAESQASVIVLGMRPNDPAQYGRLITDANDHITAIVEYADATPDQLNINLCNSGVMLISAEHIHDLLGMLSNDNAKKEYLLTDIIEHAQSMNLTCAYIEGDVDEFQGVNNQSDLAQCEAALQMRWREEAMAKGVTLVDPSTVYFSHDTEIEAGVTVQPNVFFGPNVTIKQGATILAFSHIEGAHIGAGVSVGPFARLRPGTRLEDNSKIGNFVEVKNSTIQSGAKASHLSYIGDAVVGADANIGAGTITCNYDGYLKHQTTIGSGAFIGSNTALVAPVSVGNGAIVGAGSTVTKDIQDNAIAVARAQMKQLDGAAVTFRNKRAQMKAAQNKGQK